MSASSRPTRAPVWASATARLTLVVLLPTPPLPEATATTFLTLRQERGAAALAARGRGVRGHLDLDVGHPRQAATAWRAWARRWSLTGQAGVVRLTSKATAPDGLDLEVLDEAERDDVAMEIGVLNDAQRVEYLLIAGAHCHYGANSSRGCGFCSGSYALWCCSAYCWRMAFLSNLPTLVLGSSSMKT